MKQTQLNQMKQTTIHKREITLIVAGKYTDFYTNLFQFTTKAGQP
jgi:hypothetical protein